MENLRMTDGRITQGEPPSTEAYLYQTIHTLGHEGRHLEEHAALLEEASRRWFGHSRMLTAETLRREIADLLRTARYPTALSSFVRLHLYASGRHELFPSGISLYSGYAFRSVLPAAVTLCYDLPFDEAPLSLREHAAMAARRQAELEGAQSFVRTDSRGLVRSCDDAPLFAVKGKHIFSPDSGRSVEFSTAAEAIGRRGYTLHIQPIGKELLPLFEELFYFDHRGITALRSCDGRVLMHVVAEQVAGMLE